MLGLLGRDDIYAYSFLTMARGWAPGVVPHPLRKKVSTLSHVLPFRSRDHFNPSFDGQKLIKTDQDDNQCVIMTE